MNRYISSLCLVVLLLVIALPSVHAGGWKDVTRGDDPVLNWNVSGVADLGTCSKTVQQIIGSGRAPTTNSDFVKWKNDPVLASTGSKTFFNVQSDGVYPRAYEFTLTCGDASYTVTDISRITIQDCPNGSTWDPTSNECKVTIPKGHLDSGSCNAPLKGWTCDPDNYSQPLQVHFYEEQGGNAFAKFLGASTANVAREPAVAAQCGGNNLHGFSYNLPASMKDGAAHKIHAFAINIGPVNSNPQLSGEVNVSGCNPDGEFDPPPASCYIAENQSTCTTTVTWKTTNPTSATSVIVKKNGAQVANTNSGTITQTVTHGSNSTVFDLLDNSTSLDTATVSGTCDPTDNLVWDGVSKCVKSCTNGAIDPPTCTTCPTGSAMNPVTNKCAIIGPPNVTLNPGDKTVVVGDSILFNTVATDANNDLALHRLNWKNPSDKWQYEVGGGDAITTPSPATFPSTGVFPVNRGSSNQNVKFIPTLAGNYKVMASARDMGNRWGTSPTRLITVNANNAAIDATNCSIPKNSSTCVVPTSWSSSMADGVLSTCIWDGAVCTGATVTFDGPNGGPVNLTVNGDPDESRIINLFSDDTYAYKATSKDVRGNCVGGTAWDGAKCSESASVTADFVPNIITAGSSYTLNWTTEDATSLTASCAGPASSIINGTLVPTLAGTKTAATTNAMVGITTCTFTARSPAGNGTDVKTLRVTGKPTLTAVATSPTLVTYSYACNDASARSITFSRSPGTDTDSNTVTPVNNAADTSVAEDTDYTYTIKCYDAINQGGLLLGTTSVNVHTPEKDPDIDVGGTCSNGATNPPECDKCPVGYIYDGVRCSLLGSGTMCQPGNVTNANSGVTGDGLATCGNGVIERGEQCDGAVGLKDATKQRCTAFCTIACTAGNTGAPGCGLPASSVCNNGAVQTSSPACNVCPSGQYYDNDSTSPTYRSCVNPVCGNGIKEDNEQCDGTDGVTAGKKCTFGCCLATPPVSCYPTITLTCTDAKRYDIRNAGPPNNTVISGPKNYTGPVTWSPTSSGTYRFRCINGSKVSEDVRTITGTCDAPKSDAIFSLTASPRTIKRDGSSAINWKITNPNAACKIVATPVLEKVTPTCNLSCVVDRFNEASRLTTNLEKGNTDVSDPYGANRTMVSALTGGTTAQGKKTLQFKYSTLLIGSCALNPLNDPNAVKVKIQVTDDVEG